MSALCKFGGMLVIMSTATPAGPVGRCPICKGTSWRESPYGWTECENCECDFAVLSAHLKRIPDDVRNQLGAYI